MSTRPFQNSTTSTSEDPKEDVERIRDIIFGGQMREYEVRFQMMEQLFRSEVNTIKADLERHLNDVKGQLQTEVERAREELAQEMEERRRSVTSLTEQTKSGFANVESAMQSSESRLKDAERRFQEGLVEKTQYIHEEVQASVKSLTSYLDVQTRELRENKLDRADLSKALEFVAGGLAPKPGEEHNGRRSGATGQLGARPV